MKFPHDISLSHEALSYMQNDVLRSILELSPTLRPQSPTAKSISPSTLFSPLPPFVSPQTHPHNPHPNIFPSLQPPLTRIPPLLNPATSPPQNALPLPTLLYRPHNSPFPSSATIPTLHPHRPMGRSGLEMFRHWPQSAGLPPIRGFSLTLPGPWRGGQSGIGKLGAGGIRNMGDGGGGDRGEISMGRLEVRVQYTA